MEAGKSNKLWRCSKELMLQFKSKGYQAENSFSLRSSLLFCSGLRLASHIMESSLLYSKPTHFNVNLIHPHRVIQNNV